MTKAKLILINGFNASGKTTLAKRYIADHDMAFAVEVDSLVDNMGNWADHRGEVKQIAFELAVAMARTYLQFDHDVVLPYIVSGVEEVEAFERVAAESGAKFYEFFLDQDKDTAISRLLSRGKYGQDSSLEITDEDRGKIERDYANMIRAVASRPNTIKVSTLDVDAEESYRSLLNAIHSS